MRSLRPPANRPLCRELLVGSVRMDHYVLYTELPLRMCFDCGVSRTMLLVWPAKI